MVGKLWLRGRVEEASPVHMRASLISAGLLLGSVFLTGCIHVTMDPIKVHAVVDVNVKMEQAVTNLLADIYGDSATINPEQLSTPVKP
jgi:hypothetical protein